MGSTDDDHSSYSTNIISNSILFMLSLLVINEIAINYFNRLAQKFAIVGRYVNQTIITTLIGLLAGAFLIFQNEIHILEEYNSSFSDFFIIVLLPPILFESTINMEKTHFFRNFGTILSFAIFGTLIAAVVTALLIFIVGWIGIATSLSLVASLAFGALISATDPVAVLGLFRDMNADKTLYILIYGESILNDAISIIIYQTCVQLQNGKSTEAIENFFSVFFFSIVIGFLIGIICAYVFKFFYQILKIKTSLTVVETEHIEVSITVIIPWVSYLIAEALGYSGILSIVFCGISMARYALPNLSDQGTELLHKFYHLLAYNFENLVFLFIGIGIVGFDLAWSEMGAGLCICAIISVLVARFANVRLISLAANFTRYENKLKLTHQYAFWFSGLRGAMAFALALNAVEAFQEYGRIILTVTIVIVITNIFIQGALLKPVMDYLDIREIQRDDQQQEQMHRGISARLRYYVSLCDERVLQRFLIKVREPLVDAKVTDEIQGI